MNKRNKTVSESLFIEAQAVLPSGYARHMTVWPPYPKYVDHGQGCHIWDVDGVKRIDFTNNFTSLIHGHAHPLIVTAIQNQAAKVTCTTMPSDWETNLARLICDRIPGIEQIRFANTGTEAIMVSVKMARALTGRTAVAKVEGGYHGQYDLIEASFHPSSDRWGPEDAPTTIEHNPGTPQALLDDLLVLPVNNINASRALIAKNAHRLSAILIDPLRIQLGFIEPTAEYLKMLRDETQRHGILLIFDEVIAIRASYHGCQGLLGITPDITVTGKIIGGGLPIGAVGASREIMSVFSVANGKPLVKHSGTFTANPMSLAAGYTAMSILDSEAMDRLAKLTQRLKLGLEQAIDVVGLAARVNGYSSALKFIATDKPITNYRELAAYQTTRGAEMSARFQDMMLDEGLLAMRCGYVLSTPMNINDIDCTIEASHRVFKRLKDEELVI